MRDYKESVNGEQAVHEFLCKHLYDKIFKSDYVTVVNKEAQKMGIDYVVYRKNDEPFTVDEKAQVNYINKPRDTFSFEISYLNIHKEVVDGWLIKNTIHPTYYALIWIWDSKEDNKSKLKTSDINTVECMFISNLNLQKFIRSCGFTDKILREFSEQMRKSSGNQRRYYAYLNSRKFVLTNMLPEKPVNIILDKDVLYKICTVDYMVMHGGIYRKIRDTENFYKDFQK